MTRKKHAPDFITIHQLADRLAVSYGTAYKMVRRGDIKAIRIGNVVRIPMDEYKCFLASCRLLEPFGKEN